MHVNSNLKLYPDYSNKISISEEHASIYTAIQNGYIHIVGTAPANISIGIKDYISGLGITVPGSGTAVVSTMLLAEKGRQYQIISYGANGVRVYFIPLK